jgi:hypothetical protein
MNNLLRIIGRDRPIRNSSHDDVVRRRAWKVTDRQFAALRQRSACSLSEQDDFRCLHENRKLEQQTVVLYVEQVVLQLLQRILLR